MTLVHFTYSDTYNFSQNFYDKFTSSTSRVTSAAQCENVAFSNKSSLFILSDYNETNRDASCLYSNPSYSDASFNDWISGLVQCNNNFNSCNDVSGDDYFGRNNYLSLYLSPLLTLMDIPTSYPTIDVDYFINLYLNTWTNLNNFITNRRTYLETYYFKIQQDGTFPQSIRDTATSQEEEMNIYQSILQSDLLLLNNQLNTLISKVQELNRYIEIKAKLLEIINYKIYVAELFFNVLMNKNQGAIGELDINSYNRSLSIFKNLIISIVILISIYLYFKNND